MNTAGCFIMSSKRELSLRSFVRSNGLPDLDLYLLDVALTHKSYANEHLVNSSRLNVNYYNQRLEFLGDSVIGLVISSYLFSEYADGSEGFLTKKKSYLVCEPTIYKVAKSISLEKVLNIGKGELSTNGLARVSNLADALEAVIGAYFMSSGFNISKKVILQLWSPYLQDDMVLEESVDYKSKLQEYFLKYDRVHPKYTIIQQTGEEHHKTYVVEVFNSQTKKKTHGKAFTKKQAEQIAAKIYFKKYIGEVYL